MLMSLCHLKRVYKVKTQFIGVRLWQCLSLKEYMPFFKCCIDSFESKADGERKTHNRKQRKRERENVLERDREISSTCWFTPQMPSMDVVIQVKAMTQELLTSLPGGW